MTYLEHIRQMDDGQFAYFLNMIQPEIELFMLAVQRAESYSYSGPDTLYGLNGDARLLLWIMRKDYDLELKRIEDCYNPGHHLPWEEEKHPYSGKKYGLDEYASDKGILEKAESKATIKSNGNIAQTE